MYKKYDFLIDPKNVYVVGDCHGNFLLLKYKIKENNITDSAIIIAGDCGVGFEKLQHYHNIYNQIKSVLIEQNVLLLLVRGNHDDPEYFSEEKINHEYMKTIPDYSVLSFINHNVLCVGGGISIDRLGRKYEDSIDRKHRVSYWYNEAPVFCPDILDEIKNDGINITTVITHSSPSFAPKTDKGNIQSFIESDKGLIEDIANERLVLTKLYDHLLKENKHEIKLWVYGHFHQHEVYYSTEEVKFVLLDMCMPKHVCWDIYPIER